MNIYYSFNNNNSSSNPGNNAANSSGDSNSTLTSRNGQASHIIQLSNPTQSANGATNAVGPSRNVWDNEAFENDDFDSDQLEEDESYSWVCS